MRHRISLAFYCLASIVILMQLATSFAALIGDQNEHTVLHSISRQIDNGPPVANEVSLIDFKQMAKDLAKEKY